MHTDFNDDVISDDQIPFSLGQPVFLRPDILGHVDISVWVVVGHHRGFLQHWMVACVPGDDPTAVASHIPAGLLTDEDPYQGLGQVIGHVITKTGRTLPVLQGGKYATNGG